MKYIWAFSCSRLVEVAKHAQDGTQTTNMFALVWFLTVVEPVENVPFSNQKQCRAATNKKARPALSKKKTPVSMLNRFNKTYNEADSSKTCILAWADSHYELKILLSIWLLPSILLDLLPRIAQSTMYFPHYHFIKQMVSTCMFIP